MTTVKDLKPAPYNPRKISADRLAALGKSLREFGDLGGVVVNVRTGNVIGGHQRIKNLDPAWKIVKSKRDGSAAGTVARGYIVTPWGELDYREVEWDQKKELAANLAANKHGGDFDLPKVKEMLVEIKASGMDLDFTGFLADERIDLLELDNAEAADAVPEVPAKPKSRPGDIYILGPHRVLCGDATKAEDVARVMGGVRSATCMWTDPPYGVSYVGKTKRKLHIENDGKEGLAVLISKAFVAAMSALSEGAAIYVAHPAGAQSAVFINAFLAQGWRLHETLIWVKQALVLGHSDYHYRHEPILFGYAQGGGRRGRGGAGWYGPRNADTVFEVSRPIASRDHPTSKPVDLVAPMVRNSSRAGETVFDPFLGSGTTLIVAEATKRVCRGLELDPRFVDVIVERWEKFTGRKAEIEHQENKNEYRKPRTRRKTTPATPDPRRGDVDGSDGQI